MNLNTLDKNSKTRASKFLAFWDPRPKRPKTKDGNGAVSGRISVGFGSCRFGFGDDFSPTVFGFGAPKPIGFGFPPVDIQWISEINHLELKLMFYHMLIITYLLILLNLF